MPLLVVAEISWVLSAGYGLERAVIQERLTRLFRTRGVFVEELELVHQALVRYAAGGVELEDLLIVGKAAGQAARPLFTFDKKLAREAEVELVG